LHHEKTFICHTFFTILATKASADSSEVIIIRSDEELMKLRRIAEADEEAFTRSGYIELNSHADVVAFLKFIDSLPIPYISGKQFDGIVYYTEYKNTHITFFSKIGETHSYLFYPIDIWFTGADIEKQTNDFFKDGNHLNIYTSLESRNFKLNENGAISLIMEIDGFIVNARYNRGKNNEDVLTFNPYETYKDMVVTSFAESPWSVSFTTSDALTILRTVAGLTASLTRKARGSELAEKRRRRTRLGFCGIFRNYGRVYEADNEHAFSNGIHGLKKPLK